MKKLIVFHASILLLVGVMSGITHGKEARVATMALSGTLIDNMCAGAHKADLKNFIKNHTKECALMPRCVKSGYSLYHHGALLIFDDASNRKIERFLGKKGSTLDVSVEVKKAGDRYTLVSIKNK